MNTNEALLLRAAKAGDLEKVKDCFVKKMFRWSVNVNSCNEDGQTALHIASRHLHSDIVSFLIKQGFDVNKKDRRGETPLLKACYANDFYHSVSLACIKCLVKNGADVNAQNNDQLVPLHIVSSYGHMDAIKYLLKHGADITAKDIKGQNVLFHLSYQENCFEYLLAQGANINEQDNNGQTILHKSVSASGYLAPRLLMQYGIDINIVDNKGWTALRYAARDACLTYTRYLLEQGADTKIKDTQGKTIFDDRHSDSIGKMLQDANKIRADYLEKERLKNLKPVLRKEFFPLLSSLSVEDKINPEKNKRIIELAVILGTLVDLFTDKRMNWQQQYVLYTQLKLELIKPENKEQKKMIQNLILARKMQNEKS